MQKLYSYLPLLCLFAAIVLFVFRALAFEAAAHHAQASTMLIAGSIALLASAVSAGHRTDR